MHSSPNDVVVSNGSAAARTGVSSRKAKGNVWAGSTGDCAMRS
jgi:hypothetical protein